MITPSHIIYGWALAKATEKEPNQHRTITFVLGSFLPDIPVYLFFFVHTFILGTSQRVMWDELYFNSVWSPFFTLSHSLLLWPLLLLIGVWCKQRIFTWIGTAATLHVVLDFFVHNDDAYRHFWPLTDWKFISPISYWDPAYYGNIVGAIDSIIVIFILSYLYKTYQAKRLRALIVVLIIMYVGVAVIPRLL